MVSPLVGRMASMGRDVSAGLTVAMVGLPQCLAYALLSGLPPAYGLSTAGVAGLVAAAFGKSPHVITGPTNTTGLLILGAMTPYLGSEGLLAPFGLSVLATLTLMAGLFRLLLAAVEGHKLLRYLPASVLAGFLSGVGLLIGVMQLDEALGLQSRAEGAGSQLQVIWSQIHRLDSAIPPALCGVTASLVFLGRRWKWPVALIAILVGASLGYLLEESAWAIPLVKDRAPLSLGFPAGAMPALDASIIAELALPAFAIVLLGTLELTVSAQVDGMRADMKREIGAQGLANIAGAFFSCFPASASLTRSALLRLGGAQTRLAAAVTAALSFPILYIGHDFVGHIPQASLAGVLFAVAARMLDRKRILRIGRTSKVAGFLFSCTLIGTLILPLEQAVLLGTLLGLVFHLSASAKPRLQWLMLEDKVLVPATPDAAEVVAEVSGALYYAAVPSLFERLEAQRPPVATLVVLDLSHAHELRFSALEALQGLIERLQKEGVEVRVSGVYPEFAQTIARSAQIYTELYHETPGRSATQALLAGHPAQ